MRFFMALSETVYCSQPVGFMDSSRPDMVCRLNKSLYGLKQAPRAWYSRFATFLPTLGFTEAKSDTSLFVYHRGDEAAYLLLYVDDIVLTASSQQLLQRILLFAAGVCYEGSWSAPPLLGRYC